MADFEQPTKTHPATPVVTLYVVFLILGLLTGVLANFNDYIEEKFGIDLSSAKSILLGEVPILEFGDGISLGDKVVTLDSTSIFAQPGDSTPIGSVPSGTFAKVIGGPVTIDGVKWWEIQFEDGSVGWVRDSDLAGSEVITTKETAVYANPGDLSSIDSVPKGIKGKIIDGPRTINGVTWWKVEFEDGTVGWVKEDSLGAPGESILSGAFGKLISRLKAVSTFISLIVLVMLIYAFIRLKQVEGEVRKNYEEHFDTTDDKPQDTRWLNITSNTNSENPNDWKQAILDADSILDELITAQGFEGSGLGEKLKSIRPERLSSIDSAWEAHKVRNRIAHDGGDFVLTQREAKRVVNLYAVVFRELGFL
jgi:hypothetical protein